MLPSIGLGPTTSAYTEQDERAAWPDPEVAGREVTDYHGKRAVAGLVRKAQANGWNVRVTEACGSWPSTGKRPSAPRWSLAVRLWRGNERAVAVYVEAPGTWKWDTIRYWALGTFPGEVSIAALEVLL